MLLCSAAPVVVVAKIKISSNLSDGRQQNDSRAGNRGLL